MIFTARSEMFKEHFARQKTNVHLSILNVCNFIVLQFLLQ